MVTIQTLLFLLVLFAANTVEAVTGFAGTILAMPASILLIGVDEAKVILNLMNLIISPIIVAQSFKYLDIPALRTILLFLCVGMVVGIGLYYCLPLSFLLPAYGLFVAGVGVKCFCLGQRPLPLTKRRGQAVLVGAGIMHGLFVSGGPLLVIYAALTFPDKESFRTNVSAIWIILSTLLAGKDYVNGLVTPDVLWLTALSVVPLLLAIWVGNWIHRRISQAVFLKLAYGLIILSGILLII